MNREDLLYVIINCKVHNSVSLSLSLSKTLIVELAFCQLDGAYPNAPSPSPRKTSMGSEQRGRTVLYAQRDSVALCCVVMLQVVHRLSDTVQLPPVTPCQSPEHTAETGTNQDTTQRCGVAIDVPLVQAPQVSLTTDDGDDFDVWFGRRGSIFIEERGATQRQMFLAQQTTRNAKGQVSLAVPKPTADN